MSVFGNFVHIVRYTPIGHQVLSCLVLSLAEPTLSGIRFGFTRYTFRIRFRFGRFEDKPLECLRLIPETGHQHR